MSLPDDMKSFPIVGGGLFFGLASITAQERINCYVETVQDAENSGFSIYGIPGLELFVNTGGNPARALLGVGYALYVVLGTGVYSYNNAGIGTLLGNLNTTSGRCDIAYNGPQILVVDGTTAAILIDTDTGITTLITLPAACDTACYLDSYFIVGASGTQQFFISGQYAGQTWDVLDFASAESNPDNLVRVFADHGQLMPFGEFTVEVWGNNGAQDFPFQRVATPTEWGLAAKWSVAKLDNAVAFLGRNRLGQVQVVMMSGYTVEKISTPDVDRIINYTNAYPDADAYSYMLNGHPMYVLNVSGRTLIFDLLTNMWSELQSGGSRHLAELSTSFLGRTIVSDYANGNLYNLSDDVFDDNGAVSTLSVTGRHLTKSRGLVFLRDMEIDMEHGTEHLAGVYPTIEIEISKDNGHTFGTTRSVPIGAVGEYATRTRISRLGQARDFVFVCRSRPQFAAP